MFHSFVYSFIHSQNDCACVGNGKRSFTVWSYLSRNPFFMNCEPIKINESHLEIKYSYVNYQVWILEWGKFHVKETNESEQVLLTIVLAVIVGIAGFLPYYKDMYVG